jgi:hypothetical protein
LGSSTSNDSTLSTVLPHATECAPQALLPIIPPIVQRLCVDGSGAKCRPCREAMAFSTSGTTPGCTTAVCAPGSTDSTLFRYREKSTTRPSPQALPAMLVPAPRFVIATPSSAATPTAATAASTDRGRTTTSGTCR